MKNHSCQKNTNSSGFTLLELMIVCGIVVIVLVGILATFVTCYDLAETSRNANLAQAQSRTVLENMRGIAFTSISGTYNGYTFTVAGMAGNSSLGHVVVDSSDASLLKVDVGVCWKQRNNRIIGECREDAGGNVVFSDANGNGILDSPVQVTTLMTQR